MGKDYISDLPNISRDVEDAVQYNQTECMQKSVGAGSRLPTRSIAKRLPLAICDPDRPNTRTNNANLNEQYREYKKSALAVTRNGQIK